MKTALLSAAGKSERASVAEEQGQDHEQRPRDDTAQAHVDEAWSRFVADYGVRLRILGEAEASAVALRSVCWTLRASASRTKSGIGIGSGSDSRSSQGTISSVEPGEEHEGDSSVVWMPDWCLGTLFLLAGGDVSQTLALAAAAVQSGQLLALSLLLAPDADTDTGGGSGTAAGEAALGPARWRARVQYAVMAHTVDRLVEAELPAVASAFRRAGLTSTPLVVTWLEQCFWNVLDWPDVSLLLPLYQWFALSHCSCSRRALALVAFSFSVARIILLSLPDLSLSLSIALSLSVFFLLIPFCLFWSSLRRKGSANRDGGYERKQERENEEDRASSLTG